MNANFKSYYAVIFTSKRTEGDNGYSEMSELIEVLAKKQHGYMFMESAKSEIGITISYWESLDDIQNWKQQADHLIAQKKGRSDWYSWYNVKICKVERDYAFKS